LVHSCKWLSNRTRAFWNPSWVCTMTRRAAACTCTDTFEGPPALPSRLYFRVCTSGARTLRAMTHNTTEGPAAQRKDEFLGFQPIQEPPPEAPPISELEDIAFPETPTGDFCAADRPSNAFLNKQGPPDSPQRFQN